MYIVKETDSFTPKTEWMNHFGTIVLKREQDNDFGYGKLFHIRAGYDESYSWLLLFEDGNRIDIGIEVLSVMERGSNQNKLFVLLLDKIGCLPKLPPPADEDFHIKKPLENRAAIGTACQLFRRTALVGVQSILDLYIWKMMKKRPVDICGVSGRL